MDDQSPIEDQQAFELLDSCLDQQDVTPAQSAALAAWLKADPEHADRAFRRLFLHTFLRQRLQYSALSSSTDLAIRRDTSPTSLVVHPASDSLIIPAASATLPPNTTTRENRRTAWILAITGGAVTLLAIAAALAASTYWGTEVSPAGLWAYEGFQYPPTSPSPPLGDGNKWPTSGGVQGSSGGTGWAEPWREKAPKVSVLVADVVNNAWRPEDQRKSGPLGYKDAGGRVLSTEGIQLRTAAGPLSTTVRRLAIDTFPEKFSRESTAPSESSVVWLSFLAQSFDGRGLGSFAYLELGSESNGLRMGKLASIPSGNWSAAHVRQGKEENAVSSEISSGQSVLFVARIERKATDGSADIWINPSLDKEPKPGTAILHVPLPGFLFDQVSIASRYTTDFDEIRLGETFLDVVPTH